MVIAWEDRDLLLPSYHSVYFVLICRVVELHFQVVLLGFAGSVFKSSCTIVHRLELDS